MSELRISVIPADNGYVIRYAHYESEVSRFRVAASLAEVGEQVIAIVGAVELQRSEEARR